MTRRRYGVGTGRAWARGLSLAVVLAAFVPHSPAGLDEGLSRGSVDLGAEGASWWNRGGAVPLSADVVDSAPVLAARVAAEPADPPPAAPYPPEGQPAAETAPAPPNAAPPAPAVPNAAPYSPTAPYSAPPVVPYPAPSVAPYPAPPSAPYSAPSSVPYPAPPVAPGSAPYPAPLPPPAPYPAPVAPYQPPARPPLALPPPSVLFNVWLTGYSWQDNNPRGSSKVSHPILHQTAGGEGTYEDPITAAVAAGGGGIWTPGARFYISSLARYVIIEDTGASGTPAGDDAHLDVWIDGRAGDREATDACMASFTAHRVPVYYNPPPGLPVISGPVFSHGRCNIPSERPVAKPAPFPSTTP